MDLYCPKRGCAEPVDNDELHAAVDMGDFSTYHEALHAFQSKGCEALSMTHGNGDSKGRAEVMDAMFDLLGDDADGAAAMMEDFEYMGMLD